MHLLYPSKVQSPKYLFGLTTNRSNASSRKEESKNNNCTNAKNQIAMLSSKISLNRKENTSRMHLDTFADWHSRKATSTLTNYDKYT